MAKISLLLFIAVIAALVLFTHSVPIFAEKLRVDDGLGSGNLLQLLIRAETIKLEATKDVMELQREDKNSQQLKCIPCGSYCISSRNCCKQCYCLIHYDIVLPRCVRLKPPPPPQLSA